MRRSTRTREAANTLSTAELDGLKALVATNPDAVERMLSNKPTTINVDTLTTELDHLCSMNKLSVSELLSRFFPESMLSKHLISLGKSGNGNGPTLSARLASHWATTGSKKPKVAKEETKISGKELAWAKERALAVAAVRRAALAARTVQSELLQDGKVASMDKDDSSPVTVADFTVQALVNMALRETFPDDAMISEEDSAGLAKNTAALEQVTKYVGTVVGRSVTSEEVLSAITFGKGKQGSRTWVLDPIDGTKGFIRQAQYAVCLGLMLDGHVVLGCLGCPGLEGSEGKGVLQVAVEGQGAFESSLDNPKEEVPIRVASTAVQSEARLTESYESGHTSHKDSEAILHELGITTPPLRMDSQAKYAVIARGDASLLLRIPQKTRRENIWDHAAGALIVEEAGGRITDCDGGDLDFSKGEKLSLNQGIVITNGLLHSTTLAAVQKVLGKAFYQHAVFITADNLPEKINEGGDVSVLFTAARDENGERWCPDCRQADIILEASRVKAGSRWFVVELPREDWKVNPGQDHFLRKAPYNVPGIPTLAHFRNGAVHGDVLVEEQAFEWDNVYAFLGR